jgi:hypothetical protein
MGYPEFPDLPLKSEPQVPHIPLFDRGMIYAVRYGIVLAVIVGLGWLFNGLAQSDREQQAERTLVEQAIHNYCGGRAVRVVDVKTERYSTGGGGFAHFAVVSNGPPEEKHFAIEVDDWPRLPEVGEQYYLAPTARLKNRERKWDIGLGQRVSAPVTQEGPGLVD